jgi:hypothetical protein
MAVIPKESGEFLPNQLPNRFAQVQVVAQGQRHITVRQVILEDEPAIPAAGGGQPGRMALALNGQAGGHEILSSVQLVTKAVRHS